MCTSWWPSIWPYAPMQYKPANAAMGGSGVANRIGVYDTDTGVVCVYVVNVQASLMITPVNDSSPDTVPALALLQNMPNGLQVIRSTSGTAHTDGVFCKTGGRVITVDTVMAKDTAPWLCLCARSGNRQLANCHVERGEVKVMKDVPPGQPLIIYSMYGGGEEEEAPATTVVLPIESTTTMIEPSTDGGHRCGQCGKVFTYRYYRDKHLKYTRCVDNGDRKYPCAQCSRSFEKRDRLRIHVLHVHEKHRPHECQVCAKRFSQSSSLNKHLRVHSGERPYKCTFCAKAFTASSILRTHIRQHSGERPFQCCHCGKSFASHAAHDSHVRRTHNTEPQRILPTTTTAVHSNDEV